MPWQAVEIRDAKHIVEDWKRVKLAFNLAADELRLKIWIPNLLI